LGHIGTCKLFKYENFLSKKKVKKKGRMWIVELLICFYQIEAVSHMQYCSEQLILPVYEYLFICYDILLEYLVSKYKTILVQYISNILVLFIMWGQKIYSFCQCWAAVWMFLGFAKIYWSLMSTLAVVQLIYILYYENGWLSFQESMLYFVYRSSFVCIKCNVRCICSYVSCCLDVLGLRKDLLERL
jgi:hypothetical protein